MWKTTASRLSAALLGYVTLIILLLTLNPFYVSVPNEAHVALVTTAGDVLANILLFLPIGFLYRLTGGKLLSAVMTGAGVSLSIEIIQIVIPARTTSVTDFVCNSLGAAFGALLHDAVAARMTGIAGIVGRLRLETPLMGLIYLWMPLLWVNSLAIGESPDRWPSTVLIGVCGAIVFGELWRQWPGLRTIRAMGYAALSTGIWFLIGSGLALLRSFPLFPVAFGLAIFSAALTMLPRNETDRRFERGTLRRILPFFTLYLLLTVFWPPFRPLGEWHGMFGFSTHLADTSLQGLYPRIEYLIAFTTLGYLTAEWRGRDELPLRRDLPKLGLVSTGSAILLEALIGFQVGLGASLVRAGLAIFSALFGGALYHLLRAHIRFLLGRGG